MKHRPAISRLLHIPGLFLAVGLLLCAGCAPRPASPTPKADAPPTPRPASFAPSPTPRLQSTLTAAPARPGASPTPACSSPRIEKGVIETPLLDKPMRYNIVLPPCYDNLPNRRYPVLYLLHGQNFSEDQWIRIGAAQAAAKLIEATEVPPFIIVLPYDHSYKQPTEYNFEQVFLENLVPTIESDYRTLPGRAFRAIGGLSRGGAWAIRIGTRHPDLFVAIGAHSPAVFYADMSTIRLRLRDLPADQTPLFYIDAGDNDVELPNARRFATLLDEMTVPHEWHFNIGFHDEKYWASQVENYLRWYGSFWKSKN